MPIAPSPRRYSQAVFQIALERDELDVWSDDLRVLAASLENPDLVELLDAPHVPTADKVRAVSEAIGDAAGPLAVNLLSLLASRGLAHLVPAIVDEYGRLLDEHRGIDRAEVVSAVALSADRRDTIAHILEGLVNKRVRLVSAVDPGVLGGFVAKVGDRVIDGSLRTKLREMRREIVEQGARRQEG